MNSFYGIAVLFYLLALLFYGILVVKRFQDSSSKPNYLPPTDVKWLKEGSNKIFTHISGTALMVYIRSPTAH